VKYLVESPLERSTAATDLLLAVVSLAYGKLLQAHHRRDLWRARLWSSVYIMLGFAAGLGAVAHGVPSSPLPHRLLWHPLYAFLTASVTLVAAVATYDRWGLPTLRRVLAPLCGAAVVCFTLTRLFRQSFFIFIMFEAVTMFYALAIYYDLARRSVPGAATITVGIALSIGAALVQSSKLRARIWRWDFDHNGLFHLVQLCALPITAQGALQNMAGER
jgi:hypothetical protein